MFNYGDLTLIWDALEKLPKTYRISYGNGKVKFEPTSVADVKRKVIQMADLLEREDIDG